MPRILQNIEERATLTLTIVIHGKVEQQVLGIDNLQTAPFSHCCTVHLKPLIRPQQITSYPFSLAQQGFCFPNKLKIENKGYLLLFVNLDKNLALALIFGQYTLIGKLIF